MAESPEFHKVTNDELPIVIQWLTPYLPTTYKIYGMACEINNGQWYGHNFYTIGWPEIRGVAELNNGKPHPCPEVTKMLPLISIYAPDPKDIESLLKEYCDWTKPFVLVAVNDTAVSVVQQVAKEIGLEHCVNNPAFMMQANPGDIKARPIPEGFKLRQIDPEIEAEYRYCSSTWMYQAPGTPQYFKTLISHFPNYCLTNSDNEIVCFELGTDLSTIGMLHTKEEYRGKGLAKALVSNLVQEYFKDNLSAVAWVEIDNDVSRQFHLSLGFKQVHTINSVLCAPAINEENKDSYLYEFMRLIQERANSRKKEDTKK